MSKSPRKQPICHDMHDVEIGYNQACDDWKAWIDGAPIETAILNAQEEIEAKHDDIHLLASHRRLIANAVRKMLRGDN